MAESLVKKKKVIDKVLERRIVLAWTYHQSKNNSLLGIDGTWQENAAQNKKWIC